MGIWRQTSLFAYKNDWTLGNIIPSFNYLGEPTPYGLVRKHIERYTKEGDLVLDPGCGNGTTGVIALELNRRAVLSDLNALAVRTVQCLFTPYDAAQVIRCCQEIRQRFGMIREERTFQVLESVLKEIAASVEVVSSRAVKTLLPAEKEDGENTDLLDNPSADQARRDWEAFLVTLIPSSPAFHRIQRKGLSMNRELFHPLDLEQLQTIYCGIRSLSDESIREFLLIIFYHTLLDSSQMVNARGRRVFSLLQTPSQKHPMERFRENLELFLAYKQMIAEKLLLHGSETPRVVQRSAYALEFLLPGSVDYIFFDLPGLQRVRGSEWSHLAELLMGLITDSSEELIIELDYRGRHRLSRELKGLLTELERVLKENGYLTFFFPGHYVLLSLLTSVAQEKGWQLVQSEVEMMKRGKKEEYPLMSLTLQKKSYHVVLGALNKMKIETLYDTEEAILRKIDNYLSERGTATTDEIQQFLISTYLHDCLIEKPLENLLQENFLWSGRYWLKPSGEQKNELFALRTQVMEEAFPKFVAEMVYIFLLEEGAMMLYEELAKRLLQLRPRMVFHTPYYRLLIEQCDRREIQLHSLMEFYVQNAKKDPFETPAAVLRRVVHKEPAFVELVQGEWLGLKEWTKEQFFKSYLELYEKARRCQEAQTTHYLGKRVLELLPEMTYLEERKKLKIREYIIRSEEV